MAAKRNTSPQTDVTTPIIQRLLQHDTVAEAQAKSRVSLSAVGSYFESFNTMQYKTAEAEALQSAFSILLEDYKRPEFITRVAETVAALMVHKSRVYRQLRAINDTELQKLERLLSTMSTDEKTDASARFSAVAAKEVRGRLEDLLAIADFYIGAFELATLEERPTAAMTAKFKRVRNNMTPAGAWIELVRSRLEEITVGPNGLQKLSGEGLREVREILSRTVLSLSQGYQLFRTKYLNMVIMGNPGVGKTRLAGIVAYVMSKSMILMESNFVSITSADLVAQFEGQTAAKTRSKLVNNLESVIFLDEAYSLPKCPPDGSPPKETAYASDAINEMVDFMSRYQGLYVMIVAGYEKPMTKCFLTANEGFDRRFSASMRVVLGPYKIEDIRGVFKEMLATAKVPLNRNEVMLVREFLETLVDNKYFKNSAADVQALVDELSTTVGVQWYLFASDAKNADTRMARIAAIAVGLSNFVKAQNRSADVTFSVTSHKFVLA